MIRGDRHRRRVLPPILARELRRALLCALVAGLLGLPLAAGWAVTHTRVESVVGTTPTTFTLSTRGRSELQLGIAGSIFLPESVGPLGLTATVRGPGDPGGGDGDLADYVSPEMLELYTGLFHDPASAVEQYVAQVRAALRAEFLGALLVLTLGGGAVLFALSHLLALQRPRTRRDRARLALALALAVVATTSAAALEVGASGGRERPLEGAYPLDILDGTVAAGATTDSPLIRALTSGALAKARVLVERQEEAERAYRATAEADLQAQSASMTGPREGETAVLMQSDMHCNTTMIRLQTTVAELMGERFGDGVPGVLAIAGDLTTNGTAAEGTCIAQERAVMGEGPVVGIIGNHETDLSAEQMAESGMSVLDGGSEEVAGVRFLGDGDPSRSELFGATRLRGEETQAEVGRRLRDEALDAGDDRPDIVLVHEAYAAEAFLGLDSVAAFLAEEDTSLTEPPADPGDDGAEDVPAGAIFYGHWHRSIEPRVLWNSDGSWTFVMELDTSGGAVDTPTLNNFSTPWSKPQQEASFPVVFLDDETGLVTGYQLYRFEVSGETTVEPRVEVGAPLEELAGPS